MMLNTAHLERKMLRPSFRWPLNIFLALIIFWNAEIGRLLGVQGLPLAISVVWPATGFALAAVILFGFRTWSGILLGNFLYNFLYFYLHSPLFESLTASLTISLGSLAQALFAGMVIRNLSAGTYFTTVRDVFIFLIPAGLFACTIASTVGVSTLYLYGALPREQLFNTWMTFWLGDSLGVYIFTPLLVVWTLQTPQVKIRDYGWEACGMALSFIILTLLTFGKNYPLAHLFMPLSLWITYRFRMHGATLAIFAISIAAVIPTLLGEGAFAQNLKDPLIILVSFLEVNVATCLIVAAIINERASAWQVIKKHNLDLQDAVEIHKEELKEVHSEFFVKEKLATLGTLTSAVARQTKAPLKELRQNIEKSFVCFRKLQDSFEMQKNNLDKGVSQECQRQFESLHMFLKKTVELEDQIEKFAEIIEKELAHSLVTRGEVKAASVNLHTIVNTCLNREMNSRPETMFTVVKDFDKALTMIPALPDDLIQAFSNLLENSLNSMEKKRSRLGDSYAPQIEISTKNQEKTIEVTFRDNGWGVGKERLEKYFHSFMDIQPPEEPSDIALAISHDIIVHVHHGEIRVDSVEGEYFKIKITLPKLPQSANLNKAIEK